MRTMTRCGHSDINLFKAEKLYDTPFTQREPRGKEKLCSLVGIPAQTAAVLGSDLEHLGPLLNPTHPASAHQ